MKIVIAPDSFKESLTAQEVADAIEAGFKEIFPTANYMKIPMADGGEGLVHSLVNSIHGQIIKKEVTGPLGKKIEGFFGLIHDGDTAVIEMAAAAGLHLVSPKDRNPLLTTTFGVGELILAALDHHVKHIILGLGGSATNDGGAGMLQALGASLLNVNNQEIGYGGEALANLNHIDITNLDQRLSKISFEIACDVENPLFGENGASAVFGPQKGATIDMVKVLDHNLAHFSRIIEKDLQKNVSEIPGAGAAGGLGAGLLASLPCELKRGIDIVIGATNLQEHVKDATLVITGEGKIDEQTIYGKTPIGVAKLAKKYHVPIVAIAGSLSGGYKAVYSHGIDAVFTVVPGVTALDDALTHAHENIKNTSRNIAAIFQMN